MRRTLLTIALSWTLLLAGSAQGETAPGEPAEIPDDVGVEGALEEPADPDDADDIADDDDPDDVGGEAVEDDSAR